MAELLYGERIGRQAKLSVASIAAIFDESHQAILLTRRSDNNRWCLPGGHMEAGESVEETCVREVREETGLRIKVVRLIGVYSNPHRVIRYADGNRYQIVALCFEAEVVGGELAVSDETTEFGYFTREQIAELDVMEHHIERIEDAFAGRAAAFVR
jgi:ADP-ribose pyrophosphatase YjhB (NUDIX family)